MKKKELFKPATKEEALQLANEYYNNAKRILEEVPIEYGRYINRKKVQKACGVGYLAVLYALDSYLLSRKVDKAELPTSIDGYYAQMKKYLTRNGKVLAALGTAYENLHIFGYYRGGVNVDMINAGFANVKFIIDHFTNKK